jgi:hypothetical protein
VEDNLDHSKLRIAHGGSLDVTEECLQRGRKQTLANVCNGWKADTLNYKFGIMRLVSLLPALLLLTSCEPARIYFKVRQGGAGLIAEVYKSWWFGLRSSEVPCVHHLTLAGKDAQVLWRMVVNPERQCIHLHTFVVGTAPHGFRDEVRFSSTLPSGDYTLTASGIGHGTKKFTLPLSR